MSQTTPESECSQCVDDTTLYQACKTSQRLACISSIEKEFLVKSLRQFLLLLQ